MVMKTKSESQYADMHMDEEGTTQIVERKVEASICEAEHEPIDTRELHCNMDGEDDG